MNQCSGAIGDLLQKALRRPVAFHRIFFEVTKSVKAALMASQAHFWSGTDVVIERDGWFYKTQDEWEKETCLTRREQEGAREALRRSGFWEESLEGVPAKLWYRIDYIALANLVMLSPLFDRGDVENSHSKNGGKVHTKIAQNSQPLRLTESTSETTTETTGNGTQPKTEEPNFGQFRNIFRNLTLVIPSADKITKGKYERICREIGAGEVERRLRIWVVASAGHLDKEWVVKNFFDEVLEFEPPVEAEKKREYPKLRH